MTPHAEPPKSHTQQRLWQRLWHRLQQPGDHWFFMLYVGGLSLLLLVVSLLKIGMRLI